MFDDKLGSSKVSILMLSAGLKSVNKPDSSSSVSETSLNGKPLFLYSLQYFKYNKSFNKLFPEIPVWDSLAHGELS